LNDLTKYKYQAEATNKQSIDLQDFDYSNSGGIEEKSL
jgi:hypothetical protein